MRRIICGFLVAGCFGMAGWGWAQDRAADSPADRAADRPGDRATDRAAATERAAARAAARAAERAAAANSRLVSVEIVIAEMGPGEAIDVGLQADAGEKALAQIHERQQQGKVDVLTSVRLSALENQSTSAHFGESKAVVSGRMRAPGRTRDGGFPFTESYSMTNIGTVIGFTALVQDDGSILAELDIEKSRLDEKPRHVDAGVAGEGTGDGIPEPPRTMTVKIQTTVRIPEGQTVIVSGMRENTAGDSSEMIVLVTARVLDSQRAVGSQQAATDATRVVKIFNLRNARAHEAAEFLQRLFGEGPMKVAADERTNSVLVSGEDNEMQKIEAILLRLDETPK